MSESEHARECSSISAVWILPALKCVVCAVHHSKRCIVFITVPSMRMHYNKSVKGQYSEPEYGGAFWMPSGQAVSQAVSQAVRH